MVGAGHPTLSDTLNRLTLVDHNDDGTHRWYATTSAYGTLADAVTAIGSTATTLVVDVAQSVNDLTIPAIVIYIP